MFKALMVTRRGDVRSFGDLLPVLYKASKDAQPLHIHPEDVNCSVFRNVG
jgi:hypothetical protein